MIEYPLTEVVHSPLPALARHRRGNQRRTALVLGDGRSWRLVGPGASARSAGVRFRDVARGRYRSIYQVRLGERLVAFDLNLLAADGHEVVTATVQLSWWVSDPVAAAASRVIDGEPLVRLAVGRRLTALARRHPASELAGIEQTAALELAAVSHLPSAGLSYGYGHATFGLLDGGREHLSELDRLRREIDIEDARLELQRRRILFFGELLRTGRQGLLAYWLSRSPDDVLDVLEKLPDARTESRATGWPSGRPPEALLPPRVLDDLDEFERRRLRESVAATLVTMGREELAFAVTEQVLAPEPHAAAPEVRGGQIPCPDGHTRPSGVSTPHRPLSGS